MKYFEILILLIVLFFMPMKANAQPIINSINGTVTHGNEIELNGSDFTDKNNASPMIWDNCTESKITNLWDGAWPNNSDSSYYNTKYRKPIRKVDLPHAHINRYIAGAHGETNGYNAGYNVMFWKSFQQTFPSYTYISWYQRMDDDWTFSGDNNLKIWDYSCGGSPYTMDSDSWSNWYVEYNSRFDSATDSGSWHINDDGASLSSPSSWWGGAATNPFQGKWVKVEIEVRWARDNSGYIKIWDQGNLVMDYSGPTDQYSTSNLTRSVAVGGYARSQGYDTNWRYFADVYVDNSKARLVIGNAAKYSNCDIREVQIPYDWNKNSIKFTVNQGKLQNGEIAYIYVIDKKGSVSEPVKVTIGNTNSLKPPQNLRITAN
jgi:hypothetical protein